MKKYVSPIPFLKTIQEMLPSVILSASVQDVGPREGDTRSWITVAPDNVEKNIIVFTRLSCSSVCHFS